MTMHYSNIRKYLEYWHYRIEPNTDVLNENIFKHKIAHNTISKINYEYYSS